MAKLQARNIEPLVAIARTQPHRPYDFRPPPAPKPARRITEPWRLAMKSKLESEDGKARYKKRKQTVEPVFGIVKSAIGFTRFHLRGVQKVASSGCSSRSPTTAAASTACNTPEPDRNQPRLQPGRMTPTAC